jgi:hypothetical protein
MRKTIGISLLVLLLSCSASAGVIPNDTPAPPPPAPATQEPTDEATTDGEIQNDAPDSLTRAALDLLALLPSLL